MFDRLNEFTATRNYEEKVRKIAEERFAARVIRANRNQAPFLTRLGEVLVHLGFHLERRPHELLKGVFVHR